MAAAADVRFSRAGGRAIAVLRIFFGLVFLTNGLAKLVPGIAHLPGGYFLIDSEGARSIIQHNAKHHPVALYHDLVFNFLVPNWNLFGPLVGLTETAAGLMLLLGLASWAGALLAAGLSFHIQFSDANGPWLYEYAVEWLPLICLAFMHAGMTWGLDSRLAGRNQHWHRYFG
ncbi:MAG: DoxX family membrane protein [Candidatus Dormibacteraeota bacterium]|nr:DoxX family membrane protein [Candidatus Dormibacteraeota bacterium]